LERLEAEHANLRTALQWSLDVGAIAAEMRMATALRPFWALKGHLGEGRGWLEEGLQHSAGVPVEVQVSALNAAGQLAFFKADFGAARESLERALMRARERGDNRSVADALVYLGVTAVFQGAFMEARALLNESLAVSRELGDQRRIAHALGHLGLAAVEQGDYTSGRSLYQEALAIFTGSGNKQASAILLNNLGHAISSQ
jgi:tetratricopeptide (TPR) repeat protein